MPDVTLPSGLVKPAVSSTLYGPKWNANWDLMDGLFDRVTALESATGGASIPAGSTWTDFMTFYNAADPGTIIYLPNEMITQTATLFIQKEIHIIGTGPNSGFLAPGDLVLSGSIQQIAIGYGDPVDPIPAVTLADLTLQHTRNATNRMVAISIFGHASNVRVRNITFTDITSDCVILRNEGGTLDNVVIEDCIALEWYETFFNIHEGSMSNVTCRNNVCTLLAGGHPNNAVSRPYAAIINIEEAAFPGLVENVHVYGNSFTSTLYNFSLGVGGQGGSGTDFNNSIGWGMRENNDPDFRYHRIHVCENLFQGWDIGLYHIHTQQPGGSTLFPGAAYVYYFGNTFQDNGTTIATIDTWGMTGDIVFVGDNDFIKHDGGQTALALPDTSPSNKVTITQSPANRTTGP